MVLRLEVRLFHRTEFLFDIVDVSKTHSWGGHGTYWEAMTLALLNRYGVPTKLPFKYLFLGID